MRESSVGSTERSGSGQRYSASAVADASWSATVRASSAESPPPAGLVRPKPDVDEPPVGRRDRPQREAGLGGRLRERLDARHCRGRAGVGIEQICRLGVVGADESPSRGRRRLKLLPVARPARERPVGVPRPSPRSRPGAIVGVIVEDPPVVAGLENPAVRGGHPRRGVDVRAEIRVDGAAVDGRRPIL